jgi:hypothetical protein
MSIDLVVAGAIIKNEDMIQNAIYSVPKYDYNNRYILFDGYEDEGFFKDLYEAYKIYITKKNPSFNVIQFDKNIYFRKMLEHICHKSTAKYLFVIQDDVIVDNMNLDEILKDMNGYDIKWLSFIHKQPTDDTHWFEYFDDTYPNKYVYTHGVSERVFIADRENLLNVLATNPPSNKLTTKFIDTIYHTERNKKQWKQSSYDEKLQYWNQWRAFTHYYILHKHQVGKRI